jgi:thiamine transport system permease protein
MEAWSPTGRAGARMQVIRVLPWLLVAPLFLAPLAAAAWAAVAIGGPGGGTAVSGGLAGAWGVLGSPSVAASLRFSLLQAMASAALAMALGLPGAWLLARWDFRGRGLYSALSGIPFVFPPVLFTLGFTRAWGRNGLVNEALMDWFHLSEPPIDVAYSFAGVVLAHALFNFPLVVGLVAAVWRRAPASLEDAARCLGASEIRVFLTVTLPGILPGLLAAASLVFLYCFMSFAIPLALGGGPEFATLEVAVYAAANGEQDFAKAALIALLEALCAVGVLAAWVLLTRRSDAALDGAGASEPREPQPFSAMPAWRRAGARLYLAASALLALSPVLALLATSLRPAGRPGAVAAWGFSAYATAFGRPENLRAVLDSSLLAVTVAGLAVLTGLLLTVGDDRRPGWFRPVFFALPVALSSVMLSLGYLVLFPLGGTVLALVLVQATAAYPLAYRAIAAAHGRIGTDLRDAAWVLGAGRFHILRDIELPLLRPALLAAFALCAALSLGEVNAALMLNVADFPLLGLQSYRLMGAYQYPAASALGVAVCLAACGAFALSERLSGGKHGLA